MAIDATKFVDMLAPSVRFLADRLGRKCRWHVDADDLYQEGLIAVATLAPDYDPEQTKPWSFVWRRVYGAMVDHMRRFNEFGSGHARRASKGALLPCVFREADGIDFLQESQGQEAAYLGVMDREHSDTARQEFAAFVRGLGAWVFPDQVRLLCDYYVDGKRLREIGTANGVTESWVAMMRIEILDELRKTLSRQEQTGATHGHRQADSGIEPGAADRECGDECGAEAVCGVGVGAD